MKPHISLHLFLLCVAAPALRAIDPALAAGPLDITPTYVDQLVAEACASNPALQAAEVRVQAADSAIAAVRTWEDPTASFGIWTSGPGGFASSAQGNLVYGIDQKLPLHGLPDLKRKAAEAEAARDQFAADYAAQRLRRDLQVALDNLALAGRQAEIAEQDVAWLDTTLAAVDGRYRVGRAAQVDWLGVQAARAMAGDDLTTQQQQREHGAFALNRLLNRDLHAPWPPVAEPPLQPALYYTPALVGAALAAEPKLRIMRQESVSAKAAADLIRRERLPDVSVGIQAWQYSGDGGIRQGMATVSFSVPWVNRGKYDDDWRRGQERKRASDLAAQDYGLSIREELHHHIVDLDAARRRALLYRDQLIPLIRQTLESAQAAWEHDVGPFRDILDAHRTLLTDELALARALTDQNSVLAEISLLTGSRDISTLVALAGDPASDHAGHASGKSQ
ncbi:MAG TPA: TolC family protein [Opitutaceae bacterium]|jgi:outer membrane protein TolC